MKKTVLLLLMILFSSSLNALNQKANDWWVYDRVSSYATIENVQDDGQEVIQLNGVDLEDGFALGDWEEKSNAWNDTVNKRITWRMKYDEPFKIYVRVMTSNGAKYMFYTSESEDGGLDDGEGHGSYIHHGLGEEAMNGTWQTVTRDLEADLKEFLPNIELLAVNALLVRGSGLMDDISLSKNSTSNSNPSNTKWWIYENSSSVATINTEYYGVELNGVGLEDGFALGDWEEKPNAWNNTINKRISWRIEYNEPFKIYVRVMTSDGAKYMFYTPENSDGGLDDGEGHGSYIHHGLGEEAMNGTAQTFTRDLEADLKAFLPNSELLAVNAFLIRGSGMVYDVFFTDEHFGYQNVMGSVETKGEAQAIVVSSDETKAYIADGANGLEIMDVSNPKKPMLFANFNTNSTVSDVFLSKDNTKAYLANGYRGLSIIDVSNPISPVEIGSFDFGATPVEGFEITQGLTLSADEKIAYLATGDKGLKIVDVSNPVSPLLLSNIELTSSPISYFANNVTLSLDGTKAYVTNSKGGLQIVEVSDPQNPLLLGNYRTHFDMGSARDVTLSLDEEVAYLSFGGAIEVVDITDSNLPTFKASVTVIPYPFEGFESPKRSTLSKDGSKLYVANGHDGIKKIDVSEHNNPINLRRIGVGDVTSNEYFAYDIVLSKDETIGYVADGSAGLQIISLEN